MAIINDIRTGFALSNPDEKLFGETLPKTGEIQEALKPMILSASGWRKVFAADGNEESTTEKLTCADSYLSAAMASVFADYMITLTGKESPIVLIGMDARFTGPAMADAMVRVLLTKGVRIRYLFISAAPELMAYAGQSGDVDGFIYISASHNPIGHNGVKFGLNTGGVLDGGQAAEMIALYKEFLSRESNIARLVEQVQKADSSEIRKVLNESPLWKDEAEKVYQEFTAEVISGQKDPKEQNVLLRRLKKGIQVSPLGVVSELNGSARTLSIDKSFLEDLGVRVKQVNALPRQITHRIVPEGESLNLCRETLEAQSAEDKAFQLGYVPDNDGDRGNLVYLNSRTGKAEILEAQEVFALSVLSELAYLDWAGLINEKTAVAINGPTSRRIDEISSIFGCQTFRAEVGEANVVNLAREKRAEGWQIRILGEGSNGGNITYPAAVRDPLNTLGALLKLLTLRTEGDKQGLFHIWCSRSHQMDLYTENFNLTHVLASLPAYTTSSAYEKRALMQIRTTDHSVLKARYEGVFLEEWKCRKDELKRLWGISSWEEWNQEGTTSQCGVGAAYRSGSEKGGLTILFKDKDKKNLGSIWMRGSGTEPVFRVLADWKGRDGRAEDYLLEWHKEMIRKADGFLDSEVKG
ncbi:MAG: hypothetical protein B6241_14370 [Spirochaetaceae bacterium 4572_59]|nr:MAG: hypothetical protein B6241_14370 [Spirochaetaceae bacterium 4572_59]